MALLKKGNKNSLQVRQHLTGHKGNIIKLSLPHSAKHEKLTPLCFCGQQIRFPLYSNRGRCKTCGAFWEASDGGCWATGLNRILFNPCLKKAVPSEGFPSKPARYKNYPRQRRRKKR